MKSLIKKLTGEWINFTDSNNIFVSELPYLLPDEFTGESFLKNNPDIELITVYIIKDSDIPSDKFIDNVSIDFGTNSKYKKEGIIIGFKIGVNWICDLLFKNNNKK